MAKPSNKNAPSKKAATKTNANQTTDAKAGKATLKKSATSKALTPKESAKTSVKVKPEEVSSKTTTEQTASSPMVTGPIVTDQATQAETRPTKPASNAATTEPTVVEKSGRKGGNGVAWLALLCGLGGLAMGGFAYYQSAIDQQSSAGKVASLGSQLENLSAKQQAARSLGKVTERIKAVETRISDKFSGVDASFTKNAALMEKLQAQIAKAEAKEPMALQAQTQVLEKLSRKWQQQAVESIKLLSAQVGQRVSKWQQQEMVSALSSIERHLAWTGDTQRAASGLKMLDQQIKSLNDSAYAGVASALAKDIAALEAVEAADLEGVYQQLASLSGQVSLPFLQDTLLTADKPKREISNASSAGEAESSTTEKLKSMGKSLLADLAAMVRIQNIDKTPTASLDSRAKFMVNESIRLNLKSAQLALLNKNDGLFQAELETALSASKQYFDQQSEQVIAWSQGVNALASITLDTPLPNILASQKALAEVISQANSQAVQGEQ